ncbi:RidA family protein [Leucobacter coleopterorum]|uniref:RidA family protein n=1 Tax=Leucobacter coleopterorum TaxID=2714933 RepID=A0ABX6JZ64_9MICO|nr:RidA family protein [Leucobacter coleopterorum]
MRRLAAIPGGTPPLGPYSQAVVANGFVFTAGQVPLEADGSSPNTFENEVARCIENLRDTLEAAGSGLECVVKVNGYLSSPEQLEPYNRVYARYFAAAPPARTTVCVSLWGVSMELDCVATLRDEAAAESHARQVRS